MIPWVVVYDMRGLLLLGPSVTAMPAVALDVVVLSIVRRSDLLALLP